MKIKSRYCGSFFLEKTRFWLILVIFAKKNMREITVCLFLLVFSTKLFSQGCSDAGFCSLQSATIPTHEQTQFVAVSAGYAAGFEDLKYTNASLEYGFVANKNWRFGSKLTFVNAEGTLGNNSGLGDLILSSNYALSKNNAQDWQFLLATKIPLGTANNKNDGGFALPLDYQNSLGTLDLIIGANLVLDKTWELGSGFQIPIVRSSINEFETTAISSSNKFVNTKNYSRKADVLIRFGYFYNLQKTKLQLKPNILAIYHLANDTFQLIENQTVDIVGSKGLTLNGGLVSTYMVSTKTQLELTAAMPFVVRDVRPDGLTRSFVVNLQYKISF